MVRLTLHARIEITLVAALLLGSCTKPVAADEAYDLADAASADAANALSLANDLESRLSDLEAQVELNEQNIDAAFSNTAQTADYANGLNDRLSGVEYRLGM